MRFVREFMLLLLLSAILSAAGGIGWLAFALAVFAAIIVYIRIEDWWDYRRTRRASGLPGRRQSNLARPGADATMRTGDTEEGNRG